MGLMLKLVFLCPLFQESLYAMSALFEAMKRQDVVALVRRVYRKGSAPKLGILIPEEKEDNEATKKVRFFFQITSIFISLFFLCAARASALVIGRNISSGTIDFSMKIRWSK